MSLEKFKEKIRDVHNFPQEGIVFKDITTALKDPECLQSVSDIMYEMYKGKGITKVLGVESRGFIMGATLASRINAGFVPIRKKGKLPSETLEVSYEKEYGIDTIEIHKDALNENDIVLIHDDLLATGGTVKAAIELIEKFNVKKIYVNFLIELDFLNGRKVLGNKVEIESLIHF